MTAEEFLKYKYENYEPSSSHLIDMSEYAKLKCQELLKIVAEKADIEMKKKSQYGKNRKWQKVRENEIEVDLFDYEVRYSVNKNSILNAVDLNEFIK